MKCIVKIEIRLRPDLHDPEGVTVKSCLHDLGYRNVIDVKSGKVYYITLNVNNKDDVNKYVIEFCEKLLANPVKDIYNYQLIECIE